MSCALHVASRLLVDSNRAQGDAMHQSEGRVERVFKGLICVHPTFRDIYEMLQEKRAYAVDCLSARRDRGLDW